MSERQWETCYEFADGKSAEKAMRIGNRLGRQGWELVAVTDGQQERGHQGVINGWLLWFKRPLRANEAES